MKIGNYIEGIQISPLKKHVDERGMLFHMMRKDFDIFKEFGEVYFSFTNPGIIKGWKKHLKMTQNFAVPIGEIKLVLFDGRKSSKSYRKINELKLSPENYQLVTIPPNIWYSFQATSKIPGMIANCTNIPHDPEETHSKELDSPEIPYNWNP